MLFVLKRDDLVTSQNYLTSVVVVPKFSRKILRDNIQGTSLRTGSPCWFGGLGGGGGGSAGYRFHLGRGKNESLCTATHFIFAKTNSPNPQGEPARRLPGYQLAILFVVVEKWPVMLSSTRSTLNAWLSPVRLGCKLLSSASTVLWLSPVRLGCKLLSNARTVLCMVLVDTQLANLNKYKINGSFRYSSIRSYRV